jgi:hypothetical protein
MALGSVGRGLQVALVVAVVAACTTSAPPTAPASQPSLGPSTSPAVTASPRASASPISSPGATASPGVGDFPAQVFGLPVLSIGEVNQLIASRALDGRVAAVRGYWEASLVPSCPAPNRWYSPLEGYCQFDVFSDVPYESVTCQSDSSGNTGSCSGHGAPPGAETLKPLSLDNYLNYNRLHSGQGNLDPWPVVMVGHVADPRWLQCETDVQGTCQLAFVIDTVAWAGGQELDLALQDDPYSPKPRMSIDQVAKAVGNSSLVSVALVTADSVADIEPRINIAGGQLVWVVRGTRDEATAQTKGVDVWAVDDRDGTVLDTTTLEIAPDYHPAFFNQQATIHGYDSGGNGPYPFFTVERAGVPIHTAMMGGSWTGGPDANETRWYPGAPLVLNSGDYTVDAWRSTIDHPGEVIGPATDECTTSLTLTSDQHMILEAAFPKDGACAWRAPTFSGSRY